MIRIDQKTIDKEVYFPYQNTAAYEKALAELKEALKTSNPMKIDDCVVQLEVRVSEITYKKAFHDGMKFILDAMAGREVIGYDYE